MADHSQDLFEQIKIKIAEMSKEHKFCTLFCKQNEKEQVRTYKRLILVIHTKVQRLLGFVCHKSEKCATCKFTECMVGKKFS